MNLSFENKLALVTGAASGLGLATARAFAESGASVLLADWKEKDAQSAAKELANKGHKTLAIRCDVSDDAQVEAMVKQTVATFGRLDAAYNNAGVQNVLAATADTTRADYDRVMGINLRGVWSCMKFELQQMRKQGSGTIVNCSSIGGLVGGTSTDVLLDQDRAQRLPPAQERICRVLHRLSTGSGVVSCTRSIAHERRESYTRTRSAERMAYTPFRSNLDRDGRDGLDSAVGRTNRGNSKRRRYLDSSGSETLARRNTKHRNDAHCDTGTTQWESRGMDGEGDRRAIPQMIKASPRTPGGQDETDGRYDRGAFSKQHARGSGPAHTNGEEIGIHAHNK
jgi:NAD(P)-dependent dehydrogenase (short-subunit alcohol dehydrogenase family)